MSSKDIGGPENLINREFSWLAFNDRVLGEGLDPAVPLMERAKFLAIVSSNLDEFFMIRVAGLKRPLGRRSSTTDPSGLTPKEQFDGVAKRAHRQVAKQDAAIGAIMEKFAGHGIRLTLATDLDAEQARFATSYFDAEVFPQLTPLSVKELQPFPVLPGLGLNVLALVAPPGKREGDARLIVVPLPRKQPRFINLHASSDTALLSLEDLVVSNLPRLFPGALVLATCLFRITRDGDVEFDDEGGGLLEAAERAVRSRGRRRAVRLEMTAGADERLRKWLAQWLKLRKADVYEGEHLLDATALWEIVGLRGYANLRNPEWQPQPPRDLLGEPDPWKALQKKDVLLYHPYERFDPVVNLVETAADDPNVLAIKMTLYRAGSNSPIIPALVNAAEKGKQVVAIVELRARFDESRNVSWARQLEDVGAVVIYGVAGYKTHAKALLIVRREVQGIRRYVHLSTGNYNDSTARLYTDIGLMTSERTIGADVAALFNVLTGDSQVIGWDRLVIAPTDLRQRLLSLIEREIEVSTPDQPGLIKAKMNALEDAEICRALYRASQAGVRVQLNVRGICCLRPGVPGLSENVEVVSIVDRYLEHARIYYFRNGGHDELYLASADCMRRNLDGRIETMFPIRDERLRARTLWVLDTCLTDNVKASRLQPDGTYKRIEPSGPCVRAQEIFYQDALAATEAFNQAPIEFRPLTKPHS